MTPYIRGDQGPEIEMLQILLAGFRGTVWDGDFGPGTELQVVTFQRDYMQIKPTGIVDALTLKALESFQKDYPVNMNKLLCPCGECNGFGNQLHFGDYREGKPQIERYYMFEYPGIHRAIIETYRAAVFYITKSGIKEPKLSCGYRCHANNVKKERESTNHMGKAIDCDVPLSHDEDKRDDFNRCESIRNILVEKCNFQIGWGSKNMKSLEPGTIAPTWLHMDVRRYSQHYLADRFFVKAI